MQLVLPEIITPSTQSVVAAKENITERVTAAEVDASQFFVQRNGTKCPPLQRIGTH